MAKAKKAKKAKTTKAKKTVKKAVASFELAANHPEKRYPASDGIHDILCRWIAGQGTVCKVVPKGGSWEDG
jgi:hypothetical protein